MNKLKLFVCEKFFMEYEKILEDEGVKDAIVIPFSCVCENTERKLELERLMEESITENSRGILFCGRACEGLALVRENDAVGTCVFESCFDHLTNESMTNYLTESGGFIIGLGWLNQWQRRVMKTGFDQEAVRQYYKNLYRKIVFLDAEIDPKAEKNLLELSDYLDMPYAIVPVNLQIIKIVIMNAIYQWRLERLAGDDGNEKRIKDLQNQCMEYASIIETMGKISTLKNKREAVEKIIELYQMAFGALEVKYWSCELEKEHLPEELAGFFSCVNNHLFFQEESRFCVKVQWNDRLYGAFDLKGFTNPQHIVRYLNFSLEIVKLCGVVFSNIDQYDLLVKSQKEVKYAGYHDTLTGLYNRTYLNVLLEREAEDCEMTVFLFEIDKLRIVNDTFGHVEGDKLIRIVAESLKKSFRETDYLLRSGGDEFIAILPQADHKTAETVRKRIEEEIAAQNESELNSHLKIKISMGYATSDEDYDTLSDLIHLADERMSAERQKKAH